MRALVGTLVVLAILLAGCSDGVATQSEMPVPVPSIETERPTATIATQETDRTVREVLEVIEITPEAFVTPTFEPIQGMTAEETAEWTSKVAEAGSLWLALRTCEPRFIDPIPQGGTAEQAWQAALPFLSSQTTRDCITTTVAGRGTQ